MDEGDDLAVTLHIIEGILLTNNVRNETNIEKYLLFDSDWLQYAE